MSHSLRVAAPAFVPNSGSGSGAMNGEIISTNSSSLRKTAVAVPTATSSYRSRRPRRQGHFKAERQEERQPPRPFLCANNQKNSLGVVKSESDPTRQGGTSERRNSRRHERQRRKQVRQLKDQRQQHTRHEVSKIALKQSAADHRDGSSVPPLEPLCAPLSLLSFHAESAKSVAGRSSLRSSPVATGVWSRTDSSLRSSLDCETGDPLMGNSQQQHGSCFDKNLTVLTRPRHTTTDPSDAHTVADDDDKNNKHKEDSAPNGKTNGESDHFQRPPVVTRRVDISKLRDRWWDAWRNRPIPSVTDALVQAEKHKAKYHAESNSTHDESSVYASPSVYKPPKPKTVVELEMVYINCDQPLHEAVRRDDQEALQALVKLPRTSSCQPLVDQTRDEMSPLQLAVHLDRPCMVRILCSTTTVSAANTTMTTMGASSYSSYPAAPIHMAAEDGREECLQILLAAGGSSVALQRDSQGRNMLHYACCGDAPASTLRLILTVTGHSVVPKLLSGKNMRGQTPLHCICEQGRVDLLEVILSVASLTILTRMLSTLDVKRQTPLLSAVAAGSTDVVMSLLMWRGNNHTSKGSTGYAASPCPLVWAVRSKSVEMVLLLLEFNDPSGMGYDLTNALHVAVESTDSDSRIELVRVLIGAGANPCSVDTLSTQSAIRVAAARPDSQTLVVLIDSYDYYLASVQDNRRRDHILQKQPESFFAGMESQENAERQLATRDSLVTSLFMGWQSSKCASAYHACSLVLYRRNVNLGCTGICRLHRSLLTKELALVADVPTSRSYTYQTQYVHPTGRFNALKERENSLRYWSNGMRSMPWMHSPKDSRCTWIRSENYYSRQEDLLEPDIVLLTEDGSRFLAHGAIISQKSAKLGAAVRFASMSDQSSEVTSLVEVQVSASSKVCRWMLEHIYHGSICSGLSSDRQECYQELIEVLLVAEEFICRSLVQECEMRLLASDVHRCFCCSCARAGSIENQLVDCHYLVDSPSCCVTVDSALDILAVAQHVRSSCLEVDYNLCVTKRDGVFASEIEQAEASMLQPMEALQETAICTILQDFNSVISSSAFRSQFEGDTVLPDENIDKNPHEWLLQMCLQELSNLPSASVSSQSKRLY